MSHDVFISHSSLDKLAADAVCHGLEAQGIRCWIAPRDQLAGRAYGEQITSAIEQAQVMVLIFSDNVNRSQAVLNEINIAAGANVTIVPFRLAQVDFNSELHFYLGRMHWLDAFPHPLVTYIDTLAATIRRNLKPVAPADAGAAAAVAPDLVVTPPSPPSPTPAATTAPPSHPVSPHRPVSPGLIVGGVLGALFLVLLIVLLWPRPAPPGAGQAANTVMQALANSIAKEADDSDDDDKPKPAKSGIAAVAGAPPVGDGTETTPIRPANLQAVSVYEQKVVPGGPPAALEGATVISTAQLVTSMKERDAGSNPFWLIDARGCTSEPTIPSSICLNPDTIGALETQVPDKTAQIVMFCHDGGCPMSYQMATQALGEGYTNVFWYRGGINAWMAAGGPTTQRSAGQ